MHERQEGKEDVCMRRIRCISACDDEIQKRMEQSVCGMKLRFTSKEEGGDANGYQI